MYAVLAVVLLVQPPLQKKEDPDEFFPPALPGEPLIPRWGEKKFIKQFDLEPNASDTLMRKLQKERCMLLVHALSWQYDVIPITSAFSPGYFTDYIERHATLFENLAELAEKPADKVKCYEMRVEKLKEIERFVKKYYEYGEVKCHELSMARALVIDAEIELLKLKESLKAGK
jgi:hypothetical protein